MRSDFASRPGEVEVNSFRDRPGVTGPNSKAADSTVAILDVLKRLFHLGRATPGVIVKVVVSVVWQDTLRTLELIRLLYLGRVDIFEGDMEYFADSVEWQDWLSPTLEALIRLVYKGRGVFGGETTENSDLRIEFSEPETKSKLLPCVDAL
jgi:hypothetical protein